MRIPPVAPKRAKRYRKHGRTWVDAYSSLENSKNPKVLKYLKDENLFAAKYFKKRSALIRSLNANLLQYTAEDDVSVPVFKNGYWYWSQIQKGQQYRVLLRSKTRSVKRVKAYFDMNSEARGQKYYELGDIEVSPDGQRLAYTVDTRGFREYQLFVRDLESMKDSKCLAERVSSVAWSQLSNTLLYVVDDSAKRPYRAYRLQLGSARAAELVWEERDERFRLSASLSADEETLYLHSSSHTSSELRYLPARSPEVEPKLFLPRRVGVEYQAELHKGEWLVWTNDCGPNARLAVVRQNPKTYSWRHLKDLLPSRQSLPLESFQLFAGFCVVSHRKAGLPGLTAYRVGDFKKLGSYVSQDPSYSLDLGSNPDFWATTLQLRYSSPRRPLAIQSWNPLKNTLKTLKRSRLKRQPLASRYALERSWVRSHDGVRVPVTLFYRKSKSMHPRPVYLYGYGAYGYPLDAAFSASRMVLADRGFVVALAHVRGGGELGKAWHNGGRMKNKKNTFLDFVEVAGHLSKREDVDANRIVIEGGSAGGLLMGSVVNHSPQRWAGVLAQVPFVDVVHTMLNPSLPLTVGEYEEWGNPNRKGEFEWIWSYSPYNQLTEQKIPKMLVKTSLHDSQVMYWEPAKYVAKLRETQAGAPQLLFQCNMSAGHGGASGRYDALKERASELSFILGCVE